MAEFDLAIVGGGINGAGIARDAAGRGLRVVLLEQNDLASGTSSASSKLIHGGLRYLEHGEFRLVRAALAEREILLRAALDLVTDPAGHPLRTAFRRAFEYSDCFADDARLVVLNALDSSERGASIRT